MDFHKTVKQYKYCVGFEVVTAAVILRYNAMYSVEKSTDILKEYIISIVLLPALIRSLGEMQKTKFKIGASLLFSGMLLSEAIKFVFRERLLQDTISNWT
jgi:hypothetical protein